METKNEKAVKLVASIEIRPLLVENAEMFAPQDVTLKVHVTQNIEL